MYLPEEVKMVVNDAKELLTAWKDPSLAIPSLAHELIISSSFLFQPPFFLGLDQKLTEKVSLSLLEP